MGIEPIKADDAVYFPNVSALVEKLKSASRKDKLDEKLWNLAKFKLIIVDEIGYLPFVTEGFHCPFQLVSN